MLMNVLMTMVDVITNAPTLVVPMSVHVTQATFYRLMARNVKQQLLVIINIISI